MGKHYDDIVAAAHGDSSTAGQQVLQATLIIPVVLIVALLD